MSLIYKKYSDKEDSMYDLSTYQGRLKHFARMTDMRYIKSQID
jgi:hypothetical protein